MSSCFSDEFDEEISNLMKVDFKMRDNSAKIDRLWKKVNVNKIALLMEHGDKLATSHTERCVYDPNCFRLFKKRKI